MAEMKIVVLLEGQRKGDSYPHDVVLPDLSWMFQLLDEMKAANAAVFEAAFKFKEINDLRKSWRESGVSGQELAGAMHVLRKGAFEALHNGEVAVILRNQERSADMQPGVSVTLAAVVEYLASLCGSSGVVMWEDR